MTKKKRFEGSEFRTWIMFFVALGLLVFFAAKGAQLGPYWTLMLGSMLGLTIIVSAIQGLTGGKNTTDEKNAKEDPRIREPNGKDEMGGPGISDFRIGSVINPNPI